MPRRTKKPTPSPTARLRDRRHNAALANAAARVRDLLGLATLETRGRDALDFPEVSVAALREAIGVAFESGWEAGFEAGSVLSE